MKRHKNITWFELVKYNTSLKGLLREAFENLRPITFKGPVPLAPKRKLSICFEGVLALETWSFEFLPCGRFIKSFCYIARNFFSSARGLIGYFEITWHLTIKLFPAKISERVTLQKSMTWEGNNAMLPANDDRWPPLQRCLMNFQPQTSQQYNKSVKDWSLVRFSRNKINCFPRDQSLSV